MTKAELVEQVSAQSGVPPDSAGRAVDAALAVIARVLANGGDVVLPGFGKFSVRRAGARAHAGAGQAHEPAGAWKPRFGAATPLKKRLNEAWASDAAEPSADGGGHVVLRREPTTVSSLPRSYSLMRAVNSPEPAASLVLVNKGKTSSRSLPYRPQEF